MEFINAEEALKIYDEIHRIEETKRAIEFEKQEAERMARRNAKIEELKENHKDILAAIDLAIRKDVYSNVPDIDLEKHLSTEMYDFITGEEWYVATRDFLRGLGFLVKSSDGKWTDGKKFFFIHVKYK